MSVGLVNLTTRCGGGYVFALDKEIAPDKHGRMFLRFGGPTWLALLYAGISVVVGLVLHAFNHDGRFSILMAGLFALAILLILVGVAYEIVTRRKIELIEQCVVVTRGLLFFQRTVRHPLSDYQGLTLLTVALKASSNSHWLAVMCSDDTKSRHVLAAHRTPAKAHQAWLRLCEATGLNGLIFTPEGARAPFSIEEILGHQESVLQAAKDGGLRETSRSEITLIHVPWSGRLKLLKSLILLSFYVLFAFVYWTLSSYLVEGPEAHPAFDVFIFGTILFLAVAEILGVLAHARRRQVVMRKGCVFWRLMPGTHAIRGSLALREITQVSLIGLGRRWSLLRTFGVLLFSRESALLIDAPLSRENAEWLLARLAPAALEVRQK